jgi:hypothetical protein
MGLRNAGSKKGLFLLVAWWHVLACSQGCWQLVALVAWPRAQLQVQALCK